MVHILSWSPKGRLLAAGLGDGNIPIFSIDNRNLVQTGFLPEGHDSSVASIVFPSFVNESERILCSGGSDGAILFWDLGETISMAGDDDEGAEPSRIFPESLLSGRPSSNNQEEGGLLAQQTTTAELSWGQPKILFGIPHGAKVNWMTTSQEPATLFVADTSKDITAYTIPLR
jgi:WD40 repeat protein